MIWSLPQRILLTGGTGFLGSHLSRRLVKEGQHLTLLKRSTSLLTRIGDIAPAVRMFNADTDNLEDVFRNGRFDAVVHCATNYGRGEIEPLPIIEANLSLPVKLLMLAQKHGVPVFVNTDTILDKGIGGYSLSKRQFLEWLDAASDRTICLNVALEHFFGPGDDDSKFVSHVVQALAENRPVLELTPGEQQRDFIYIDDVVSAFWQIIGHAKLYPKGLQKFELGSGQKMTIRRFVELAKAVSGNSVTELRFGAIPYRKNETMDVKIDVSKIFNLGWNSRVSTEDGLRKMFAHARAGKDGT